MQKLLDIGFITETLISPLLSSPPSFEPHQHFCLLFTVESNINMMASAELSLSLFTGCVSLLASYIWINTVCVQNKGYKSQ